VGLLFVDFCGDGIGLHVNGCAAIVSGEEMVARAGPPGLIHQGLVRSGRLAADRWVLVSVEEAYIHCAKHIPRMAERPQEPRAWGTDDPTRKRGDYFQTKHEPRPWVEEPPSPPVLTETAAP